MDRASGSGVFARDPDALLDLIELEPTEELLKQEENKAVCAVCIELLKRYGYETDIHPEDELPGWKKAASKNKKNAQDRKADRKQALQEAVEGCNFGDVPSVKDVAEYLGISERTVRDRIKEHGGYVIKDGNVHKKEKKK